MEALKHILKEGIIKWLDFDDLTPEEIESDAPLFGEGLGLDSIDALELVVMLQENYGIEITDISEGKKIFASVSVLAQYVDEHRQK